MTRPSDLAGAKTGWSLTGSSKAVQASAPGNLPGALRQMIAVLERERQALASLDADGLFEAAREKDALCDTLGAANGEGLDPESRSLAQTAQQLNDVNRRVRNLLAANVATRLEALGAPRAAYKAGYRGGHPGAHPFGHGAA